MFSLSVSLSLCLCVSVANSSEFSDPATLANGPAIAGSRKADGVVAGASNWRPTRAAVQRVIRSRGADRHQYGSAWRVGDRGSEACGQGAFHEFPSATAVAGRSHIVARFGFLLVIASHNHSVPGVFEGDRKDSCR